MRRVYLILLLLAAVACRGGDSSPSRRTLIDSRDTYDPRSLDPALSTDVPTGRAVAYVFDGLVRFTPDAQIVPGKMGHAMPPPATLSEVVKWLDEDADRRASAAKKSPASRAAPDGALTREENAKAILDEAKQLLGARATMHRGLMLLKGAAARWPDLAAGKAALKLLQEYDAKTDRPWEDDDVAEQRKQIAAEARGLGDYALNGIPAGSQYEKQKPDMAKRAIDLWGVLIGDAPDSPLGKEGKKLVAELEPLARKKK